jgi:hypothetical protein
VRDTNFYRPFFAENCANILGLFRSFFPPFLIEFHLLAELLFRCNDSLVIVHQPSRDLLLSLSFHDFDRLPEIDGLFRHVEFVRRAIVPL